MGDMRAEHAAKHVQFVDHDVSQAHEECVPLLVPREQTAVQHFGVGEHNVGGIANGDSFIGSGVTVVCTGNESGVGSVFEGPKLVVGKSLGGVQQQCGGRFDRVGHGLGNRELKASRLSRCGTGGDDNVVPGSDEIDGLGLMTPQRPALEVGFEPVGERVTECAVLLGSLDKVLDVDQPTIRVQLVEQYLEGCRRVRSERHGPMLWPVDDRITPMWSDTVQRVNIVAHAHRDGQWSVITVAGELDVVGAPELRQHVMRAVADGLHHLVLDLSGIDFIDSFGLGVLIGALKRVRLLDGDLQLVVTEPRVRRVFELCDLDRVFTLHRDVRTAVALTGDASS